MLGEGGAVAGSGQELEGQGSGTQTLTAGGAYSPERDCMKRTKQTRRCVCRKMRILAAGGDGTVAWILKTIRELALDPEPHVAVMPLGTGNDLSLSFGWGNTFLKSWINVRLPLASRQSPVWLWCPWVPGRTSL